MKWGIPKGKDGKDCTSRGRHVETNWTDIIQRLVDEWQAQNAKDNDERRARIAKEESKLTQILTTAQTIVKLVVNPIQADADAIEDTIAPLREELRDGLVTVQTMVELVVNSICADVDAIKGTTPRPPFGKNYGSKSRR